MTARFIAPIFGVIGTSLLIGSTTQPATAPAVRAVGAEATDFVLESLGGRSVRLFDQTKQGPVVLVVLRGWPGYQCPICTRQVADLMSHEKQFADAGAQVLLVYPGPSDQLKAHANEFVDPTTMPENFHFLIDPDYKFTNAYGLRWNAPRETAYPSTFVIDNKKIIRLAKVSRNHGDRVTATEILKALDAMK
jgi:peroxiredoxin